MSTKNQPLQKVTGPSTLARAKFGPGMLLQHDDLDQLNTYTRDLSRLMFSSLFGCGVVCGLVVSGEENCGKVTVDVGCGLALDCQGDPIQVSKPQRFVIDTACVANMPPTLWVVLRGTAKSCAPRTAMCGADDDEAASMCTRERDCFEIRVERDRPGCSCGGPDPDSKATSNQSNPCACADPAAPSQKQHYEGLSCCDHVDCGKCDCDDVVLARLDRTGDGQHPVWTADHRARRFVRPVLMRDPQVWIEQQAREQPKQDEAATLNTQPATSTLKKTPS